MRSARRPAGWAVLRYPPRELVERPLDLALGGIEPIPRWARTLTRPVKALGRRVRPPSEEECAARAERLEAIRERQRVQCAQWRLFGGSPMVDASPAVVRVARDSWETAAADLATARERLSAGDILAVATALDDASIAFRRTAVALVMIARSAA